jgi:hypothetical protein
MLCIDQVTDLVGSVIWALTLGWLGYFFALKSGRIVELAAKASSVLLALIAIAGLVSYVSMKYARRRKFLNELRLARITPRELKQKLRHYEPVTIVDLRHSLDFLPEPYTIPVQFEFQWRSSRGERKRFHATPKSCSIALVPTKPAARQLLRG